MTVSPLMYKEKVPPIKNNPTLVYHGAMFGISNIV